MSLRGLCSRCELLELAVVNGEVGAEVTAELQGLQAAAGVGRQGMCKAGGGNQAQP